MNNNTTKKIVIIGAGQAGLLLAIGLIKQKFSVTLYSLRDSASIHNGPIMSSQVLFQNSLEFEHELGLNYWEHLAPKNKKVYFNLVDPHNTNKLLTWHGETSGVFTSVDQRIKYSRWLEEFEELGGKIVYSKVDLKALEKITQNNDLCIVASGKSKLSEIFPINEQETIFSAPKRNLALLYVKNYQPTRPKGISINILPGIGEYFCVEGLSHGGNCHMMLFEFHNNTQFDVWHSLTSHDATLERAKLLLQEYLPGEYARARKAELVDDKSILLGSITPTVRHPICTLPNNKLVLGMGDTILLNDPIAGQGANCATKAAKIYLQQILSAKDNNFNFQWMQETYKRFWDSAKWSYYWSNILLDEPEPHIIELLSAAADSPILANKIANIFNDPINVFPHILNEKNTKLMIQKTTKRTVAFNKENNQSLNIYQVNDAYLEKFKTSKIMDFITGTAVENLTVLEKFLACIQTFSNHFQNAVMLRKVFTANSELSDYAQTHLLEELGHNIKLQLDRGNKDFVWDPILEATTSWFSWKMMVSDDIEKHVIMHMVLEASAYIFFKEADRVMKKFNKTSYFALHADLDKQHAKHGEETLLALNEKTTLRLIKSLEKAWSIFNITCNRIAELSLHEDVYILEQN